MQKNKNLAVLIYEPGGIRFMHTLSFATMTEVVKFLETDVLSWAGRKPGDYVKVWDTNGKNNKLKAIFY